MARDDDEAKSKEELEAGLAEPSSGQQIKFKPSDKLQLFLAHFRRMAREASNQAELQAAVDELLDHMVEQNAKLAPRALRDEVRARLRTAIENDPAMKTFVDDLREAAKP